MNIDILQDLNDKYVKDFNEALNIYENTYSHEDLISFLKDGSVAQKQSAVVMLDNIFNTDDANALMNNLTGCDGKIREAVSFRLKEFVKQNPEYFVEYCDIFLAAIIDINGNICRNTISALKYLKDNIYFREEFLFKLVQSTLEIASKAVNFDKQDGKYKINKEIFKLYWYLETVYEFCEFIDFDSLYKILKYTCKVMDYTIREKTAKILAKIDDKRFDLIKSELKQDENYYVRRF